ncbi:protein kinase domain-containing protein [Lyngbya aestuarii]|uniref:protein kinase domain-containing protein n=1 Tax=Lyngbya aestuarii TaxID=118322 RepID=UPI00403E0454
MLGKLLDGRYQVTEVLGAGGFSKTYLAQDTKRPGNPICVIKQLKPANSDQNFLEIARRLFRSEAETLEKLGNHDQIPRLLAYFEEDQEFYLAQEFIEGHTLSQELQPEQKWPESEVIELLREVLLILEFVHSHNVIHRDIKPDNIIRRQSDNKLVLVDFGAVKQVSSQLTGGYGKSGNTVSVGTPGYMSSEQALGQPRPSSDIYGLGIIGIQALTGMLPDQLPEDLSTGEILWEHLVVPVSRSFGSVLTRMVRYHFKDRYQSAADAMLALRQLQSPQYQAKRYPAAPRYSSNNSVQTPRQTLPPPLPVTPSVQRTLVASPGYTPKPPGTSTSRLAHAATSDHLPVFIGIGLALAVGALGLAYGIRQEPLTWISDRIITNKDANSQANCTVVNAGLNVRSEPTGGKNNVVEIVKQGTNLALTGQEQNGWVEISSPVKGWVFNENRYINCTSPSQTPIATAAPTTAPVETVKPKPPAVTPKQTDGDSSTMEQATDKYQEGDLEGAISDAESIIPGTAAFKDAQAKIQQWREEWSATKEKFDKVKTAYDEGRWADVVIIATDSDFPEQRYWPEILKQQVEEAKRRANQASPLPQEPSPSQQPRPQESVGRQPAASQEPRSSAHYVLINDTSDRTLQEVQKSFPNAFVADFSGLTGIQVGVFENKVNAQRFAGELKQQGFPVSIYSR